MLRVFLLFFSCYLTNKNILYIKIKADCDSFCNIKMIELLYRFDYID